MSTSLTGGIIGFLGGGAISAAVFGLNYWVLVHRPAALGAFSAVRLLLSAGYLTGVFLLTRSTGSEAMGPLIGAAVGLTVPSILLSFRLARINDARGREQKNTSDTEKGEDANG